jgi:hypothetical protein
MQQDYLRYRSETVKILRRDDRFQSENKKSIEGTVNYANSMMGWNPASKEAKRILHLHDLSEKLKKAESAANK